MATKKAAKKNPQDLTGRNLRALRKTIAGQEERIVALEGALTTAQDLLDIVAKLVIKEPHQRPEDTVE